jgi:membrane associated rhomboid family serine protease
MFLVFGLQLLVGREGYWPFMEVPAEVVRSWQNLREGRFGWSDLSEFGTIISSIFLHGDGAHIVFNMFFLWLFAALAVDLLGHAWMLAIFFFTGITGSLCHTIFNAQEMTPVLGASGAVMGFEGAYLGMAVRWHLPDPHVFPLAQPVPPANLVILALIGAGLDWTAIMSHSQSNVAYGAHLGGFIGGIFLASFIVPKPREATAR